MWNAQSHQIWQKSRPVAFNLASDSKPHSQIALPRSHLFLHDQPVFADISGTDKKEQILEAIAAGTNERNLEDLRKMKKADLVAAAERRLAQSRWLPEVLKS